MKNIILNKKVALGVSGVSLLASFIALPFTTNIFSAMEALEAKINISLLIAFLALTSMLSFFVYKGVTVKNEQLSDEATIVQGAAEENEQISEIRFNEEYKIIVENHKSKMQEMHSAQAEKIKDQSPGSGFNDTIVKQKELEQSYRGALKKLFLKAHTMNQVDQMKECKFYNEIMNEDSGLLDKVNEIKEKHYNEQLEEFNKKCPDKLPKKGGERRRHSLP